MIDSVAALTPRAEIEGEMGDTHVGLQARLMSQALRKLTGNLNKTNTIAIFINQLREKIGVMFGCFSYGTRVTLADGTQEKIGKIVNQKLPVEVLSYDFDKGELVAKPVTNWFDNGVAERFLQFTVERGGGNGRAQFAATENHLISTPGGWRPAGELVVGDRVLQAVPQLPERLPVAGAARWAHGRRRAVAHPSRATAPASVGATVPSRPSTATGRRRCSRNINVSRSTNAKGAVFHDVQPLPELAELREAVYVGGKKVLSDDYLKRLTPLSLAVWYMDDGGFTLRSEGRAGAHRGRQRPFRDLRRGDVDRQSQRAARASYLADTWGIEAKLDRRGARQMAVLQFPTAETAKLHALDRSVRAPVDGVQAAAERTRVGSLSSRCSSQPRAGAHADADRVDRGQAADPRSMHRFDIEVGGTHNYFVDGVMVHNSPETTPGRAGAEVLLVGPSRHPPHRVVEGRRRGGRQPHPGQGREEQGVAAVQAGRVRHHVRPGHQP